MYKFILTDQTKTFVFDFSFGKEDEAILQEGLGSCRYVKYDLYRTNNDREDKIKIWEGFLCVNQEQKFELRYPDHIDIKGSMSLFQDKGKDYIFMDTFYGFELERHFDGNIMEIPANPLVDPIGPIKPLPIIDPSAVEEEFVISDSYNDLFPYLYVKEWPELSEMDVNYFMYYNNNAISPPANFYADLLSFFTKEGSPEANSRANIQALAYDFVNGISPYENEYINGMENLPKPFNSFPRIYDELQKLNNLDAIEIEIYLLEQLNFEREELKLFLDNDFYRQDKDQIWQSVLALSIIGFYNNRGLQELIKTLLVCHILEEIILNPLHDEFHQFKNLLNASLVLPGPVFPLPPYDGLSPITSLTGCVVPYAMGDLQMIQHQLIGYRTGEVAHIENVLPGEIKEVSNSSLEELNENSTEQDQRNHESETQWTGSMEGFNTEIAKTFNKTDNELDDFKELTTSYGPPTTGTYGGSVNFKNTITENEETGNNHFAKQILDQTVERLNRKMIKVFQKNKLNRTEEATTHTLDNRNGLEAIRGIYSWVNKVYSSRVVNYGNRFLLEFLIDKPILKQPEEFLINTGLIPPNDLPQPINSFKDISLENYADLAAEYGINNVNLPPAQQQTTYCLFNDDRVLSAQMIAISENYIPSEVAICYSTNNDLQLIAGEIILSLPSTENNAQQKLTADISAAYEADCMVSSIPILLTSTGIYTSPPDIPGFYVSVSINSVPSKNLMDNWRLSVYDALMQAYQKNKSEALKKAKTSTKLNKQKGKEWVNYELIRTCKALLYQIHLEKSTPAQPSLSPPIEAVDEPIFYEFFNLGLEWNEATYSFSNKNPLPQKENVLKALLQEDYNSTSYNFLESDKIRVMVPVSPSFNYRVLYYLNTGLISEIKDFLTPIFESTEHIALSLKQAEEGRSKAKIESPWEVLIPTNMQWLQNSGELPTFKSLDS